MTCSVNFCHPGPMYTCKCEDKKREGCKFFKKASYSDECMYLVESIDMESGCHCSNIKAQAEAK